MPSGSDRQVEYVHNDRPSHHRDPMKLVKAHAFGNDFLLVEEHALPARRDEARIARVVCDRHRGIGADGLMIFSAGGPGTGKASMRLLNADGSPSEISGNGLRCLAAWIV